MPADKKKAAAKKGTGPKVRKKAAPGSAANKKTSAKRKPSARKARAPKTASGLTSSPKKRKADVVLKAPAMPRENANFFVVGIGASAGGLEALEAFFREVPEDSGMAYVVVAHLDPDHVSLLPELLQRHTKLSVTHVKDGGKLQPNAVFVIPPNKELSVLNGVLHLMDLSLPRRANLPIDIFLRSLAQDQGARAIGIILSGTGTDGTQGIRAVKGEGGMVMVQDEETAKYGGMPHNAIATGLADFVLPPGGMPRQLLQYAQYARGAPSEAVAVDDEALVQALEKIFVILRTRTGHDFSHYNKNTICRRVERRMTGNFGLFVWNAAGQGYARLAAFI